MLPINSCNTCGTQLNSQNSIVYSNCKECYPTCNNCASNTSNCGNTTPTMSTTSLMINCNVPICTTGCEETFSGKCIIVQDADKKTYTLQDYLFRLHNRIEDLESKLSCVAMQTPACSCSVVLNPINIF